MKAKMAQIEHYVFQFAILIISVYMLVQAWKENWWEVPLILAGSFLAFFVITKYVGWLVKRDMSRGES